MSAEEIKKLLKTESLVIGSENTMKLLRKGELEKVFLASNAPKTLVADMTHYAGLNSTAVETLEIPNNELGLICKKPFFIACIGIRKATTAPAKKKQ